MNAVKQVPLAHFYSEILLFSSCTISRGIEAPSPSSFSSDIVCTNKNESQAHSLVLFVGGCSHLGCGG